MAQYAPQKHNFNTAVALEKWYSKLLWLNFFLTLLPLFQKYWQMTNVINNVIVSLNTILITGMCIIGLLQKHGLNKAENIRRDALLDDAFGTKLGDENAIGYYDNSEIESGYKKLLANVYENSLISYNIVSKMRNRMIVPGLILGITIIPCIMIGFLNVGFSVPLLQLFMSGVFVEKMYFLSTYMTNVKWVMDRAKEISENLSQGRRINEKTLVKILQLLLRYETNISRNQIILNEKIYNQMNPQLTETWSNLKKRYSLN